MFIATRFLVLFTILLAGGCSHSPKPTAERIRAKDEMSAGKCAAQTPAEKARAADLVFLAEYVEAKRGATETSVTLVIKEVFKGALKNDETAVLHYSSFAEYGKPYFSGKGKKDLVYANLVGGYLHPVTCSPVIRGPAAQNDLRELRVLFAKAL